MKPELSIIIVNYNAKEYISSCLTSIHKYFDKAEIIVIDNNSTDGSVELINLNYPDVKLIANKVNKGFSSANNQGIITVQSENILLLNPDTEIIDGSLDKMLDILKLQKDLCIIGPKTS